MGGRCCYRTVEGVGESYRNRETGLSGGEDDLQELFFPGKNHIMGENPLV